MLKNIKSSHLKFYCIDYQTTTFQVKNQPIFLNLNN